MAPLLRSSLCSLFAGLSSAAGASTHADLQRLFLSVLLPYFDSPQAVLSFPVAATLYLTGLQHCVSVEATWEPIERLLAPISFAIDQACSAPPVEVGIWTGSCLYSIHRVK